ncbi:MAG: peptidyl-prolyl cis-trans isomerase [Nitrospirae bacterium]|nr:peptidyl-prolyl cis-trans isomerase [Nitrospirota bacterium]
MAIRQTSFNSRQSLEKTSEDRSQKTDSCTYFPLCYLSSIICLLLSVFCLLSLWSCASAPKKEKTADVLAIVEGEPITEGDLEYSLEIAHRREDLSSAKGIDISQYMQKLVDDRLIAIEAKRAGVEKYPEVQNKIEAYILRESVVKLYNEEIEKKINVSEADIVDYYKKNNEEFSLGIIELSSEKDAQDIMEKLKKGEDFKKLAAENSTHVSKKDGGEITLQRRSMGSFFEEAASGLKPGDLSGIKQSGDKYYIVKLINRQEAPEEGLEKVRGSIAAQLKSQKAKDRSNEYLRDLREKIKPRINNELLSSINLKGGNEEREKWAGDERPLVEIDSTTLKVKDFVAMLSSSDENIKEPVLNRWIDRKLVDVEALARHYELNSDLKDMLQRYKNQILKDAFTNKMLVPQIKISDQEMTAYYSAHKEDFANPLRYKLQQITVKTREEAEDILKSLKNGADFSWLAKTKSIGPNASTGGTTDWLVKEQLPAEIKSIIDTLNPGDIGPVVEADSNFEIFRLQEKTPKEFIEFNNVKPVIQRKVFMEKFKKLYDEYLAKLKKDAQITINEAAVESFKKMFGK